MQLKKESTKKVKDTIVANGKIKSKVKKEVVPSEEVVLPENTVILKEILSQTKDLKDILDSTLKELLLQSKEVNILLKALKERFI